MTDPIQFKREIQEKLSQDYNIEFLGNNFDKIVLEINKKLKEKIILWIKDINKKLVIPLSVNINKNYKKWIIKDLLVFRLPFSINNIEYRILLVKVKNSVYIEFHLGKHNYYDKIRKDLGLR
jgi:hypothetical protein